ncbi:MAG: hypothetical protein GX559_00135, partial [Candidatus Pacebacteria bacterium]|nr:hypothetical protein [Candidatus Paceibacterota bacterium]
MKIADLIIKFLRKKSWLLIFSCLLLLGNFLLAGKNPAVAADEDQYFSIKLHSTYQVNANGKTLVTQKFTIRNLSPEYFISKYGIIVSSTNLENIRVTDNGSVIE